MAKRQRQFFLWGVWGGGSDMALSMDEAVPFN